MKRRTFISSFTVGSVAAGVLKASNRESIPLAKSNKRTLSLPPGLKRGSRIGIACPASGISPKELRDFEQVCFQEGLVPVLGRNITKNHGYLSAPDQDRADELMAFIEDPTIDAIMCARGGYGVMRILPMLDYKSIRQARKSIVGFSDITALLVAVNQLSGMVTFHGPVATSTFDSFTREAFRGVLMPQQPSSPFSYSDAKMMCLSNGIGRGRLTGGNLTVVTSTLGTNYEIDTDGAILFLEEINEEPYQIDRMLTQLWLAGKLQTCAGIAFGNFRNCEARGKSISQPSLTLLQVLKDRTASLGVPVVYGMPFGHVKSKLTIPLGIQAELDASNKSMRFLSEAVALTP